MSFLVHAANLTKYFLLNDERCMVRLTIIDMNQLS